MKDTRTWFTLVYMTLVGCLFLMGQGSGNLNWNQIRSSQRHGAGTSGQSSDGTGATGNVPKYDSTGTLTDSTVAAGNATSLSAVPFCTGFTPTTGQVVTYTTSSSPNPCWTASTPASGGSAGGDLSGTYPNPTVVQMQGGQCVVSVSGSVTCNGNLISGNSSGFTGSSEWIGKTSGTKGGFTVADSFGSSFLWVLPSSVSSGLFFKDGGSTTCPTNAPGAPTTCEQISLASASGSGALTQIGQVVTSGSQSTVTFSSISGSYTNLVLQWGNLVGNQASNNVGLCVEFNGDTTNGNYRAIYFQSSGSSLASATSAGGAVCSAGLYIANFPGSTSAANSIGEGTMRMNSYTASNNKRISVATDWMQAASTDLQNFETGAYLSNSAITSITLLISVNTIKNGSVFTLYGEQ